MRPPESTPWFGETPVENTTLSIGNSSFIITEKGISGIDRWRLWPVEVMLAELVSKRSWLGETVCEFGPGCTGLAGFVAASLGATLSFVEADKDVRDWLLMSAWRNKIECPSICSSWIDEAPKCSAILGSELIWPIYQVEQLAECIDKCWTGKGPCWLMNSQSPAEDRFTAALKNNKLGVTKKQMEAKHPDGRKLTATLWDIWR